MSEREVSVVDLEFRPYVTNSNPDCAVNRALSKLPKKQHSSLLKKFDTWIASNPDLIQTRVLQSVPSPAALISLYLANPSRYRPFIARIHVPSTTHPTLSVFIQTSDLLGPPCQLTGPSVILQTLFWHISRLHLSSKDVKRGENDCFKHSHDYDLDNEHNNEGDTRGEEEDESGHKHKRNKEINNESSDGGSAGNNSESNRVQSHVEQNLKCNSKPDGQANDYGIQNSKKLKTKETESTYSAPCGFVNCDASCCPLPIDKRQDFQLNTVYKRQTVSSRSREMSLLVDKDNLPSNSALLSLPQELIFRIAFMLTAPDLDALSESNPAVAEFLLHVVPGLQLHLFPHQVHALRRMTNMEKLRLRSETIPLVYSIAIPHIPGSQLAVDLVDGSVLWVDGLPCVGPPTGGLFCDEPGLGKTITAIALILKTLGQALVPPLGKNLETLDGTSVQFFQEITVDRYHSYGESNVQVQDRKTRLLPETNRSRTPTRRIRRTEFLGIGRSSSVPCVDEISKIFLSHATLVVVPTVLVTHWLLQISKHVERNKLRVLHVRSKSAFPNSAVELATQYDIVIVSFDVVRVIHDDLRGGIPVLMQVYFVRLIVDEGHSLSSANITNFASVCQRLRARSRWIMTGTPTPSSTRSDIDHLYSLLHFIREESYGLDRRAWEAAIRIPYFQFRKESLERLGSVLSRVMIRGDKSTLPARCSVHNVILDFSTPSAISYNGVVRMVRRNLITSDWYCDRHEESLLNKKNYNSAAETFKNLKLACCAGGSMSVEFTSEDVVESLDMLYEKYRELAGIKKENRFKDPTFHEAVLESSTDNDDEVGRQKSDVKRSKELYEKLVTRGKPFSLFPRSYRIEGVGKQYERAIYSGRLHTIAESFLNNGCCCELCDQHTVLPMVTPCGHLLCDECVVKDKMKCVARGCGTAYKLDKDGVPEDLIELQPSATSEEWAKDWSNVESEKIKYLMDRITGLPLNEDWEPGNVQPTLTKPKVIVHSEYHDHLKLVALRLKTSQLRDAYVEMSRNTQEMEYGVRRRRASDVAERSVERFRDDNNINILLMNSRHGAVGLDLSFVQYVFLLEPVWDASVELQIISRAHRIGCKRDIFVERLVMRNSVEEGMLHSSVVRPGVAEEREEVDHRRTSTILRNLKLVKSKDALDRISSKRRHRSQSGDERSVAEPQQQVRRVYK